MSFFFFSFQTVEPARLFEWVDGPLVEAMHKGDLFLADEISLADDSVLERLNSLLGMYSHMVTLWSFFLCSFP
jgi:midasin (ATPase involved in ribosome maturation)